MAGTRGRGEKNGVLILLGEFSDPPRADEQDALVQAAAIEAVLEARGVAVFRLTLGLDLAAAAAALGALKPAFVINLVEQIAGNGRLVVLAPALLDHLGIPYSGAGTEALGLTTNKPLAKRMMRAAGLPTPDWRMADEIRDLDIAGAEERWIVKSCFEEASIGLDAATAVVTAAELAPTFAARAGRPGEPWFAERYIEGREFNLALLESGDESPSAGPRPRLLPAAEIRFENFPPDRPRIIDYAAKWDPTSFAYRNTPRQFPDAAREGALIASLEALALDAWSLFGLKGYARVDFRVDGAGRPWLLEVNANPCLSPDAGFAAQAAQAGLAYTALIEAILPGTLLHRDK